MEIAKLQVGLDARAAKAEAKELKQELQGVGDEAERTEQRSFKAMNGLATTARIQAKSSVADLRKEMEAAEKETIAWASATARQQVAQGNLAGAVNTLSFALSGARNQTVQLINAQTQLLTLQNQLARSQATNTGGAGGSGGGITPAAASSAAGAYSNLYSQIMQTLVAYLSLRQAMRGGDELIRTRILYENLDLSLKAITGSSNSAAQEIVFLRNETDRLGLNFEKTIPEFTKIVAAFSQSGIGMRESEKIFTDISVATRALGLSTATTNRVLYDMQEMASLGTVQMRQLRQMIMQVPGGLEVAARAAGVTSQEFHELLHNGLIPAKEFLPLFAEELRRTFGSEMESAANSTESQVNRVSNAWSRLKKEIAESLPIPQTISLFGAGIGSVADFMEARRALSGAWTPQDQRTRMMQLFPNATPPTLPPSGNTPAERDARLNWDGNREYLRMRGENYSASRFYEDHPDLKDRLDKDAAAWESAHQMMPGASPTSTSSSGSTATSWTEHEKDNWQKLIELQDKFFADSESGTEKQLADIDRAYEKSKSQLDDIFSKPPFRVFHPGKGYDSSGADAFVDMYGDPYADLKTSRDAKRSGVIEANADKTAAKDAEELNRQYRESIKLLNQIEVESAPDKRTASIARENQLYQEQNAQLVALYENNMISSEAFDAAEAAHLNRLKLIDEQYSKTFVGEATLIELARKRIELEKQMLALRESDSGSDEQAKKIQDQLRSVDRQVNLKLATGDASPAESFVYGWEQAANKFGTLSHRIANTAEGLANSISENVTKGLMDWIDGTKSAEQAFADMARAIVKSLVQIMIQQLIVKSLMTAGSALGLGGSGGSQDARSPTTTGTDHSGGVVGFPTHTTSVSERVFYGARRFHTGGVVGDEVPIIARKGEGVFTAEQMKALGENGKRGAQKVEIINVVDPRMIDEHISANPQAVLNVIHRNRSTLKKMLA